MQRVAGTQSPCMIEQHILRQPIIDPIRQQHCQALGRFFEKRYGRRCHLFGKGAGADIHAHRAREFDAGPIADRYLGAGAVFEPAANFCGI